MKRKFKQFHHYHQNEQSPLTSNHWTSMRPWYIMLGIQFLAWDRHKKGNRVKPESRLSDNWFPNDNTDINNPNPFLIQRRNNIFCT